MSLISALEPYNSQYVADVSLSLVGAIITSSEKINILRLVKTYGRLCYQSKYSGNWGDWGDLEIFALGAVDLPNFGQGYADHELA